MLKLFLKESGFMKTRMQKYYDGDSNTLLREQKNLHLYDNMDNIEDIDYKIDTNATVLQDNAKNIDVEHIKKILDTKYKEAPKRRSILLEEETQEELDINFDETREYDINAILERARSDKEVNYEKERLKKLRDTQFDILTSLDIENEKNVPEVPEEHNELMDLINTITARELVSKEKVNNTKKENDVDPLDILTELKGSDDTVIVGGAHETESIGETSPIMSLEEADKIKPLVMEKENLNLTNTLQFTQSDFDDFNELKKEVKSSKALIYAIIVIVSLVFIAGLIVFLNKFLNLNWF